MFLDVQLFNRHPSKTYTATEFVKLKRALHNRLAPLGYRAIGPHSVNKPPLFAFFDKHVDTLAAARRERARLDRVLFGD